MASDRRFFFDMTNGGQAAGRNMTIGVQQAGLDIAIAGQRAGLDMAIGSQLAGRNLTIGSPPDVQPAGRMTEFGFAKVVGAVAVVMGIIFWIIKAVFVADMAIGGQLAVRNLTIGSPPDVQPAGRMTEFGFDKVVGAVPVVMGIIFWIIKAVFVGADPLRSEKVNKKI